MFEVGMNVAVDLDRQMMLEGKEMGHGLHGASFRVSRFLTYTTHDQTFI